MRDRGEKTMNEKIAAAEAALDKWEDACAGDHIDKIDAGEDMADALSALIYAIKAGVK